MKKRFFKSVIALTMAAEVLSACSIQNDVSKTDADNLAANGDSTAAGEDEDKGTSPALPTSADFRPQDDFYGYVNADALSEMSIAFGEYEAGSFSDVAKKVDDQLDTMIRDIASSDADYPADSGEKLIRDYYDQLVSYDYQDPGEATAPVFKEVLARIEGVSSVDEYVELMGYLYRNYGLSLMADIVVDVNMNRPTEYGVGLAVDSYPFGVDLEDFKEVYDLYIVDDLKTVLSACGAPEDEIDDRCDNIIYMLVDIAQATDFDLAAADYAEQSLASEELSFADADALMSNIDLTTLFKAMGASEMPDNIVILDGSQLEVLNNCFSEDNLRALQDYAIITFISSYASYLPSSMTTLRHCITVDPITERDIEDYAIDVIKDDLSDVVADCYTRNCCDPETAEAAMTMCEEIRSSYRELIGGADWISQEGRRLLLQKLEKIDFLVGARTPMESYSEYKGMIGSDPLQTQLNMVRYYVADSVGNINGSCSRDEFGMESTEVNACYMPNNTVTIPYAIMQGIFFDKDASRPQNYGALGSVIGHEVSHAFDSNCIFWDSDGFFAPDWIPQEDVDSLNTRMELTARYYDQYTVMDVYHVDGELTLSENFADLGGLQSVLNLMDTRDDREELLLSYAGLWCTLQNNEIALSLLTTDVHSPGPVRVNAVVSSCDEFYEVFDVHEGDAMYVAPEDRVTRW